MTGKAAEALKYEQEWQLFKDTGSEEARSRLAENYLPLVKYVIDRIAYKLPEFIDREDLISEGILGLIDAIDKFDPSRMNKFETYAIVRIRGSVLDSLRHMDWVPRSLRQKSKEIESSIVELERKLGRSANEREVAEYMGISVEELNETLSEVSGSVIFSFEELLQMSDDDKPLPFMARVRNQQTSDPSESIMKGEIRRILIKAVETLPENEKKVIGLYYTENMTMKHIGEILEVTESRVCQIHTKALLRLRASIIASDENIYEE